MRGRIFIVVCNSIGIGPAICAMLACSTSWAQEIVIDNRDARASQSGNWYVSSGMNPYLGESLYSIGDARFTWNPDLSVPGDYDVYAWWTYHPNRSNNVPYRIELGTSLVEVLVDQGDDELGGQWNLLGRFSFDTRFGSQPITLSGENGQASADAVRFVKVEVPKVWPEVACVCDEYYARAVDKYLAYGGSMAPPGFEGGATEMSCSDPSTTLDVSAKYSTIVNSMTGDTVSLHIEAYGSPSSGGTYACYVSVDASFLPRDSIYSREPNISVDEYTVCRASVEDFCRSDPVP